MSISVAVYKRYRRTLWKVNGGTAEMQCNSISAKLPHSATKTLTNCQATRISNRELPCCTLAQHDEYAAAQLATTAARSSSEMAERMNSSMAFVKASCAHLASREPDERVLTNHHLRKCTQKRQHSGSIHEHATKKVLLVLYIATEVQQSALEHCSVQDRNCFVKHFNRHSSVMYACSSSGVCTSSISLHSPSTASSGCSNVDEMAPPVNSSDSEYCVVLSTHQMHKARAVMLSGCNDSKQRMLLARNLADSTRSRAMTTVFASSVRSSSATQHQHYYVLMFHKRAHRLCTSAIAT
eukprot:2573-Heterococcus_DN1.PRE.2